ncbi:hypothetical protein N8I74_18930 [Chitiniphilus purpureus]|uniref:Uncharacterized protein n=1 Tax=Chitiniphilus purpureus TaxID=2981137 RepID=A0ABY6DLY7_9NEIS|nr:hypothetical protein [Chitiniphilus sp. CD1]UXY15357.1 hypothetical protein N8I74_18930 [Chitiniphilus sp. CD1]
MAIANEEKEALTLINGSPKPEDEGWGSWMWQALQGDFNENRSAGQIGFDMVVSFIPIVDTICDIRDLCANISALRKDPKNKMIMFMIVLTVIGFFPEIGSLIKGVIKIIFVYLKRYLKDISELTNAAKLVKAVDKTVDAALPKIMEFLQNSDVLKWATKDRVPDLLSRVAKEFYDLEKLVNVQKLKDALNKGLDEVVRVLTRLHGYVPAAAADRIEMIVDTVNKQRKTLNDAVQEFVSPIRTILLRTAKRLDDHVWIANSRVVNKGWIAPVSEAGAAKLMNREKPVWAKVRGKKLPFPSAEYDLLERQIKAWEKEHPSLPKLNAHSVSTFHKLNPQFYPEGTVLYRIVDPASGGGGQFWVTKDVFDSLKTRADWREKLAVKPDWNQNGQYVTYTVPKGGLHAYEGPAASQELAGTPYMMTGGANQVFFQPKPDTFSSGLPRVDKNTGEKLPGRGPNGEDTRYEWKDVGGEDAVTALRVKINDPNIKGPFATNWGFTDWTPQQAERILISFPKQD